MTRAITFAPVEIAGDDPTVLWMAGFALWQLRIDLEGAMEPYDRAIALNPSSAQALTLRGWALARVCVWRGTTIPGARLASSRLYAPPVSVPDRHTEPMPTSM
jgi:hypothetical protein